MYITITVVIQLQCTCKINNPILFCPSLGHHLGVTYALLVQINEQMYTRCFFSSGTQNLISIVPHFSLTNLKQVSVVES